jgi:hypothetical protein
VGAEHRRATPVAPSQSADRDVDRPSPIVPRPAGAAPAAGAAESLRRAAAQALPQTQVLPGGVAAVQLLPPGSSKWLDLVARPLLRRRALHAAAAAPRRLLMLSQRASGAGRTVAAARPTMAAGDCDDRRRRAASCG